MDDLYLNFFSTINNIIDHVILMYYSDNKLDISINSNSNERLIYNINPKIVNIAFNNIINKYNNYALINVYSDNNIHDSNVKKVLYNINQINKVNKINDFTLQIICAKDIIITHSFVNPQDLINFEIKLNKQINKING